MRRVQYVVLSCLIALAATATAKKVSPCYNPYRPDGSVRPVTIKIEWENPDLDKETQKGLKEYNLIVITASADGFTITKGEKTAELKKADYNALWTLLRDVKVWELDDNMLTEPRPIGVPIRIFSIKMESCGEKYFSVDVKKRKSRKHFEVIEFIDKLCEEYWLT